MWRNYDEAFDLAVVAGKPVAATNGGLIELDGTNWKAIASPSGLRSIDQVRPFVVAASSGRRYVFGDGVWNPCTTGNRSRDLEHGVLVGPTEPWLSCDPSSRAQFPTAPPSHAYSLLRLKDDLLAGTSDGIYRYSAGNWLKEPLPSSLPISRPNGIACVDGTFVIGGLGGLFVGRPGAWVSVCSDSIRQIIQVGHEVWVVHGNGALDKLDTKEDRLYPDIMTGASKRPWTSCVGVCGELLLCGGLGGWSERGKSDNESFPAELSKDVVTAIAGRDSTRWIATEQSGVVRFGPSGIHRWNPGNGLTDTWVTSLCRTQRGLVVGTMHAGLFLIVGDKIAGIPSPSLRVTQVFDRNGILIVGGMDGAWIQSGNTWKPLEIHNEETTSIAQIGKTIAVTTASGAYFF